MADRSQLLEIQTTCSSQIGMNASQQTGTACLLSCLQEPKPCALPFGLPLRGVPTSTPDPAGDVSNAATRACGKPAHGARRADAGAGAADPCGTGDARGPGRFLSRSPEEHFDP